MKRLALAAALLLAAPPVSGAEPLPRFGDGFTTTYGVAHEFDRLVALLGDDALRDLVCRLSHERYTPGRLSSALGLPEGQVLRRLNTLHGWGLVRLVRHDSARTIVEPLPGGGEATLKRWADKYCAVGDACGRPMPTPLKSSRANRKKNTKSRPGAAGGGGKDANFSYWLLKSEPRKYSWDDMVRDKRTYWDGVRNYQASKNLKAMKVGDRAFFYHSVKAREIVGVVEIVKTYYPDHTDSTGRFGMVDVKAVESLLRQFGR